MTVVAEGTKTKIRSLRLKTLRCLLGGGMTGGSWRLWVSGRGLE